jgi:hypothetical protein
MRFSVTLAMLVSGVLSARALADATARTADARGTRSEEREAFFESKIRPVLATTCFKCHGGKKTGNHLRVDRREALLKGGDSGPAIVPGDPEKSLLIRALRYHDDDLKMPPDKRLPAVEIADFERWVRDGAVWPERSASDAFRQAGGHQPETHWAFQPVRTIEPPRDSSGWSASAVDCFIHAGLQSHRLKPAAAASRRTLLRRAYFDLIGLPPTPQRGRRIPGRQIARGLR